MIQHVIVDAITEVMKTLRRSIRGMDEPAVEKISEDSREDPFQVLISTMLSAQTRDPVTHAASMRLFEVGAHAADDGDAAGEEDRTADLSGELLSQQGAAREGRVPADHRALRRPRAGDDGGLLTLPGVGRKTANLVLILSHASRDNICVDTHVHRISNRLGWVQTRTPEQTEQALYRVVPRRWWPRRESVSRHVGAERLPAGVSALPGLRAERALS